MISPKLVSLISVLLLVLCVIPYCKGRQMNKTDYSEDYVDQKEKKLLKAVMAGDTATIRQLAAHGVNLHAVGLYENTPLTTAIKTGQKKAVHCLLDLGVNPNFRTPAGVASAEVAAKSQKNLVYLEMLFDYGLDPNLKSEDVPLIFFALSEGNWRHYDLLLAKGADINSRNGDGSSLLLALVMQLEYDRAKDLLLRGADCTVVSMTGLNVLDELVDYQRRFCTEPNLPDCHKRAELLRLMQERGMTVPPGLPCM